jgi:hypothetical protein
MAEIVTYQPTAAIFVCFDSTRECKDNTGSNGYTIIDC